MADKQLLTPRAMHERIIKSDARLEALIQALDVKDQVDTFEEANKVDDAISANATKVKAGAPGNQVPPTEPSVKIVDIHPEGDVVFVCNYDKDNVVKLRAHSAFISLGSPVLKVMLGPHFKEGAALRTNSEVVIPLPDDDPDAMKFLLFAMHMRWYDVKGVYADAASAAVDIAITVDKYDCAESMKMKLGGFVSSLINTQLFADTVYLNASLSNAGDLLLSMAVMKDARDLQAFGIILLGSMTSPVKCSKSGLLLKSMLTVDIIDQLKTIHRRIFDQMREAVEVATTKMVDRCGKIHYRRATCVSGEEELGISMCDLARENLGLPRGRTNVNLRQYLSKMISFTLTESFCPTRATDRSHRCCDRRCEATKGADICSGLRTLARKKIDEWLSLHYCTATDADGRLNGFSTPGVNSDSRDRVCERCRLSWTAPRYGA
ncbi:hypothetical protein Q7P37_004581 [Cladosporium fusiforme]